MSSENADRCDLAPLGWWCRWHKGHQGPCFARPLEPDRLTLREYTDKIEQLAIASVLRDVGDFGDAGKAIAEALRERYTPKGE
jgi:hypothetical protein